MDEKEQLSALLSRAALNAKYQDGGVLVYNRTQEHLSRGLLVDDIPSAIRLVRLYVKNIRTNGFSTINLWAKEHTPSVKYKDTANKADPRSYYHVKGMSTVSRINLLTAARKLSERAEVDSLLSYIPRITKSQQKRYLKIKKVATIYRQAFLEAPPI